MYFNTRMLLAGFVTLMIAGTTLALDQVDKREIVQKERIENGVKDGSLTRHEARKLNREQRRIHRVERRSERDGVVTPREDKRLDRMQDKASRDIYKQKHDKQERR
jgi:hypothetical protein